MPRKNPTGPKLSAQFRQPIRVDLLQPLADHHLEEFQTEYARKLREGRLLKLLLLAEILKISPPPPEAGADQLRFLVFFRELALALAVAYVPGFQAKPLAKWDRGILTVIATAIEAARANGKTITDFGACLGILQQMDPDLRRPGNRSRAAKQAKTLRNRVVQVRKTLERKDAGRLN